MLIEIHPQIEESWHQALQSEFSAPYFTALKTFLQDEKKQYTIYPPGKLIFNAFNLTPLPKVKVVILGQDPYHGPGQAHGLCFSVPQGTPPPPSLKNIFKELQSDVDFKIPEHGNLEKWAQQGVLLINTTLTVREAKPTSHAGKGWETFTDAAIRAVSNQRDDVVFLLWGNFAFNKQVLIDIHKHKVLKAPHPSPLSASRGFFGCQHFSKTNAYLQSVGQTAIDWQI